MSVHPLPSGETNTDHYSQGTPAEEGAGGKLKLLAAGAYEGVDACLMVHPGPGHLLKEPVRSIAHVRMLANVKMSIHFTGREAHAAIAPWDGVNALDAVCLSYSEHDHDCEEAEAA